MQTILRTQNSELKTQNSELETQNSSLETHTNVDWRQTFVQLISLPQNRNCDELAPRLARTQSPSVQAQTPELKSQFSELETQNSSLETQNSKLNSQNSMLHTRSQPETHIGAQLLNHRSCTSPGQNSKPESQSSDPRTEISELDPATWPAAVKKMFDAAKTSLAGKKSISELKIQSSKLRTQVSKLTPMSIGVKFLYS